MHPPGQPPPLAEEQAERLAIANALDALVAHPGWRWVEDRLSALVAEAQHTALQAAGDSETMLEALRRWQVTDEIVSSLRYEIASRLEERKTWMAAEETPPWEIGRYEYKP